MTIRLPYTAADANRAQGFTLIEILLAVAVFAIVLAAINTVFFGALRLRNKTQESIESALPIQQAIAIIKRDLEGIMLPGGILSGSLQTTPTNTMENTASIGARVSGDIFTTTGVMDDDTVWSEVQKVSYFLAVPTNNAAGKELIRTVTHNLLPVNAEEPVEQFLLGGVDTMTMEYYDGATWAQVWDSTTATNLPTAIRVEISLLQNNNSRAPATSFQFIVPVMVQALTNLTSTATVAAQ